MCMYISNLEVTLPWINWEKFKGYEYFCQALFPHSVGLIILVVDLFDCTAVTLNEFSITAAALQRP